MPIVPIEPPAKNITLGISACLLGHKVRYDGGHKRSSFCVNTLDQHFHFESICPEVAIGLGTPREPIRLVSSDDDVRVVGSKDASLDVTDRLRDYGRQKAAELDHICGYILMQKSPSCGMERVKVYQPNGYSLPAGAPGAYAGMVMGLKSTLPFEEDGRLHDPVLRENFFTRVFAYHQWQRDVLASPSQKAVVDFHSSYKYTTMAHNPSGYTELGRMVADIGKKPLRPFLDQYFAEFMKTLSMHANRKSNTNAMMHILGYVKKSVNSRERNQFLKLVEEYRQGSVPLIAPVSLLRHFVENHGCDYIQRQTYLHPYPDQLGLRNEV